VLAGQAFRADRRATEAGRGDDETGRTVTISHPYFIGKYPVTRGQFARFVAETGYRTEAEKGTSGGSGFDGQGLVQRKEFNWRNPGFAQDDDHPVVIVTYDDALAFTQWLSRKAGGRSARRKRNGRWPAAPDRRPLLPGRVRRPGADHRVVQAERRQRNARGRQKKPNALGLFDMSGNVNEWSGLVRPVLWRGRGQGPAREPVHALGQAPACPARRLVAEGRAQWPLRRALSQHAGQPERGQRFPRGRVRRRPSGRRRHGHGPRPARGVGGRGIRTNGRGWPTWLALLRPVGFLAGTIWFVVTIVRRVLGGGAAGGRTHIGDDGCWIYSPDTSRGRAISYSAVVDGVEQPGSIASPGSQGEYVYTGARPSSVKVLGMAAAVAAAALLGQDTTDEDWRRRERERDDLARRDRDSSSFTGYPSAY
jgi:hypothetical protein